ncbi:amidohydrolase family protein [Saccharopolyspora phatthalungensis]|uniref:Cytosine/adenosine deaminase-related metal-dependent hydrolase n=1 Tax=Saccharopolyspora phatthalungensis TaxID=664693 RepID=A0A840QKJ4_9PSEU|nr:amidohydrolase family protein [Saccharopolyspora phatthalungensis]MBB5158973.1 cytosine/adenosine deaminase-related metal-dependent hydrolase [Saccharopolyspora phatthalungensis]
MPVLLVQDGCVYTADAQARVLSRGCVLVVDDRIDAVGTADEVGAAVAALPPDRLAELTVVDASGMAVLPGFVNPHWHETFALRLTNQNALRPVSDRDDVGGPLSGGGDPYDVSASFDASAELAERLTPGEAEAIARYSMWTQLRCGVTTLGDTGSVNRPEALAAAARSLGMRCAISLWTGDAVCTPDSRAPVRTRDTEMLLARTEDVLRLAATDATGLLHARPSAIYLTNMTDELGAALAGLVERYDVPFTTHVAALRAEARALREHFGLTGIRRLAELGLLTDRLMAVHCGFVDDEEQELLLGAGASITISPAKYGCTGETVLTETNSVADLRRAGLAVSISTDGSPLPAPGMVEAMRAAWHGFAERSGDPAEVRPTDALAMATRIPARGLRWAGIGSIEPGKQADLVLVRTDDWRYLLQSRPLESLLLLGGSRDVDTVLVAGRVVVSDGHAVGADEDALRSDYLDALESFSSRCFAIEAGPLIRRARRRPTPRRDRHAG